MIYPKFLKDNSVIGVTAPSNGISDELDLKRLDNAKSNFEKLGYKVIETNNVRTSINERSASAQDRASYLESLFLNPNVDLIISACGGEYIMEIIPYLNYDLILNNPKWFQGYSDPTWLTYTITTNLDIATIYSNNYKAFGMDILDKSILDNLSLLKGNQITQNSFTKYEGTRREKITGLEGYNLTNDVNLKVINSTSCIIKGRIIGGCMDVLGDIFGTKFDKTISFIEKYKEDGILWYFENFSYSLSDITRFLWKFKESGYFKYVKGFIFGRSLTTFEEKEYISSIMSILKDLNVPIIIDADIGHIAPRITIINGSIASISCKNGKGSIKFEYK